MLRSLSVVLTLSLVAGLLDGCKREERRFRETPPATRSEAAARSGLYPGMNPPASLAAGQKPGANPYEGNAWALGEGKRLYRWFNCSGCHSNGGGGIGPPFLDRSWRYGGSPADVYASIVQGRPNGMPSFRGRLNDQQVWQLVSFVRSLSGMARPDTVPGRSDSMNQGASPSPPGPERPGKPDDDSNR